MKLKGPKVFPKQNDIMMSAVIMVFLVCPAKFAATQEYTIGAPADVRLCQDMTS